MGLISSAIFRVKDFDGVDRLIRHLDSRIKEIAAIRILRGRYVADVDVTTSGTEVLHGLGKTPIGVIVIKSEATVTYKSDQFTARSVRITSSSGTRTVSLWIF